MLRPYYEIAEAFSLSLTNLPILIRLCIPKSLQRQTTIFEFLRVDKIDIGAVSRIFKLLSLLFDVHKNILVKI